MTVPQLENQFLDLHGREVHAFSMQMANVGFTRMADLLKSMLASQAWRSYRDGLGKYAFLQGEFDYFLSQQGIQRDDVMRIPDVELKKQIEAAMDERRTGEKDWRRPVLQARAENPQRPGQPIEPFGLTRAELKSLVNSSGVDRPHLDHRPALGRSVRRWGLTEGRTKKAPSEEAPLPLVERLRRSAMRLGDDDLGDLITALKQEQRRRHRSASQGDGTT